MFQIIRGQISLMQYFLVMMLSTVCLVSVVGAAYLLPHNKEIVAAVVMILSFVSIGTSAIVINLTLPKKDI